MNRRSFFSFLAAFALSSRMHAAERPVLTALDLEQFTPISKGIGRASAFTLYEGLPHPMWESDQLKKELAGKKTIKLHDYSFYERPLALAADEVAALSKLSSAADSYWSYGGPKLCGGFHPDYCLSWKDGDATYQLLICFGCHEMKLYGPKEELVVDLRQDAFKQFEALLKKHRDQRPER